MGDDASHSAGESKLLGHAESNLALTPISEIGTGPDPAGTIAVCVEEGDGAYQVPALETAGGLKAEFSFEGRSTGDGLVPEFSATDLIFRPEAMLLVPATAIAEALIAPFLIDVGKLTVVVRCPDEIGQSVRELLEARFGEFRGLFGALEIDGHDGGTKLTCRLNLHLGPGCALTADDVLPRAERGPGAQAMVVPGSGAGLTGPFDRKDELRPEPDEVALAHVGDSNGQDATCDIGNLIGPVDLLGEGVGAPKGGEDSGFAGSR